MSLIQVSNLTFSYDGSFETIFDHVSFQIDTNWRLGFTGRNGRGKTTFLNLLLGKYEYQGSISASVAFSCFPYDVPDKGVLAIEVVEALNPDYEYWQIAREMGKLQLDEELLYRPYETLSGGEQTKLQLAVLFSRENNFLLIDEPTNHLDIRGRELVSGYLSTKKGFILVSHDRAFLDGCVDHILSINKANIEVQRGNFSTWYENKRLRDAFEQAENEKLKKEITRLEETARQKANWSDRVEATKIGTHSFDRGYIGHKAEKMMSRSKAIEKRQQAAIEEKSKLLKNIERTNELKIYQTPFHIKRLAQFKDEYLADMGLNETVTYLYFKLPEAMKTQDAPKLVQHTASLMPCFLDKPSTVSGINVGGASKGLSVYFIGSYVEREEITFSDVCFVKWKNNQTEPVPFELKKVQLSDGQWAYYYHDPGYRIPPKVDDRLPISKRMRVEHEHSIIVRFVPRGDPRKILDITVVLVPDKNQQGQTGWNVWHQFGTKKAYIQFHNSNWSKHPNCEHLLLREEDFD